MKASNVTVKNGDQTYYGTLRLDKDGKRLILGTYPGAGKKAASAGLAVIKNPEAVIEIAGVGGYLALKAMGKYSSQIRIDEVVKESVGDISDTYRDMIDDHTEILLQVDLTNAFSVRCEMSELSFSVPGSRYRLYFKTPKAAKAWADEICRLTGT